MKNENITAINSSNEPIMKKVLVTGAAGFIGARVVEMLLEKDNYVVGLDNLNDYYDVRLKYNRLAKVEITAEDLEYGQITVSNKFKNYSFIKLNIEDRVALPELFAKENFDIVCNLAAQAGVRYSIENPNAYIDSNLVGFANILECCRHHKIKHLVYASSSSVYGMNSKVPFSEDDQTDEPVSLYAATKKANELMAHAYSSLYKFPATGLRFFTVYGPWGRPDMAPMLFAKAIMAGEPINVFNNGDLYRDFTYIDDIAEGVLMVIDKTPEEKTLNKIYNIGCAQPVHLLDFIRTLETTLSRKAKLKMMSMQAGDVLKTYADTKRLNKEFGYKPKVQLEEGIEQFIKWYLSADNKY
jgi:UDP-glucuronate 4-epimerase